MSTRAPLVVGVTGASGFVGAGVAAQLGEDGHRVVSLGRHAPATGEHRDFDLGRQPDADLFRDLDALVHCAYDFRPTTSKAIYERNVLGTIALLDAAADAGVRRIVFVSSMSAYPNSRQRYARAKLEGERLVDELGGVALRLGLVWGADAGGMAGAVTRLARAPLVPVLGRRSHQFTVHRDDAVTAITLAVADPTLTGVVGVAHPDPVPTPRLIRGLAAMSGDAAGRLVPVPWRPVYWSMRAAEAVHAPLPLRADSVLGLVRPAPFVPRVTEWADRGLVLRSFPRDSVRQ